MEAPGFWDDPDRSNKQMKELKNLKDTVGEYKKLADQYEDILTLIQMGYEENDESLIPEIAGELAEFKKDFDELRIGTLLSGEYDKNNAILKLNAGAGGTESCVQHAVSYVYQMGGAKRLCGGGAGLSGW